MKFLVPILLYGPNNQYNGLLEAMAVAKLTGRILVVPKYFARWYRDDTSRERIPVDSVFEPSDFVATVTPDEVRDLYVRKLRWTIMASPVPTERLRGAMDLLDLPCCPGKLSKVPAHSRAATVVDHFTSEPLLNATFVVISPLFLLDQEKSLLVDAAKHRHRAHAIRYMARRARSKLFGDTGEPLLAVHIRRESTNLGCAKDRRFVACNDPGRTVSTAEILNAIVRAAANANVRQVYLAHAGNGPSHLIGERYALITALRDKGIDARSASQHGELARLLGSKDAAEPYWVSLVEQEICVDADAFLPSARSTWSATVILDRAFLQRPLLYIVITLLQVKRAPSGSFHPSTSRWRRGRGTLSRCRGDDDDDVESNLVSAAS